MTQKEENGITKTYLRQVSALTQRIKRGETELKRLQEERTYIGSINYGGDHVQASSDGLNAAMRQTQRIVDVELRIKRLIVRRMEVREKIIRQIDALDDPMMEEILASRYVDGMDFEEIAEDMGYSYDYILHRHGEALSTFFAKYLSRK